MGLKCLKFNNPCSLVIALNTKSKYESWNFAFTSIVVKYTAYKQKSNSCSLCEEKTQKGIELIYICKWDHGHFHTIKIMTN
jgi:hypothetical protein